MTFDGSRRASRKLRAAGAALFSFVLASCTAGGLESLEVGNPAYTSPPAATTSATPEGAATADGTITPLTAEQESQIEATAFVPTPRPGSMAQPAAAAVATEAASPAPATAQVAAQAEGDGVEQEAGAEAVAIPQPAPRTAAAAVAAPDEPAAANSFAPAAQPPKRKGFLSALFSQTPQEAPVMSAPAPEKPKPVVKLAAVDPVDKKQIELPSAAARASLGSDLPGVRKTSLFEITRKNGLDDDSDVDLHEDEEYPVQMASAAGMARLAPNGLLRQREGVDVACLKPSLVRMLKQVERHYGRKVMVTSGYRSPEYNKRVRGARKSMHMYCAAADVQVQGISKWELARYVRAMPGRGGVGTYCHTESVHIDVGPERDWNWRCRRRG